ncbi:MAG: ABC transporter ATP-binding protein [Bacteroidales bacterium]|nr:ABC transporter ATP-binding protein [Bacteroidales bacterium]
MKGETAIQIRGLSKCYRIGHQRERTLHGSLGHGLRSLFAPRRDYEEFWALSDIDMDVRQGQVQGIIGRNGAGKTTLLKLLSRITYPTRGSFTIHGRVASLLEVGTGFHPELSGRENIFLNGTILGMSRAEIRQKFDEIVDFSGVEHFLDTPVKRYSSGMYVRLAFAVAAHLEPEVLIVDEVLAVGDAAFQRKCLGKMGEVARMGRTVLFVSHNMAAVAQLCNRVVLLEEGRVAVDGGTEEAIARYLSLSDDGRTHFVRRYGNRKVEFIHWELLNQEGEPSGEFLMGDDLLFRFRLRFNEKLSELDMGLSIRNAAGDRVTHLLNHDEGLRISGMPGEELDVEVRLAKVFLSPGRYIVSAGLEKYAEDFDVIDDALSFAMVQGARPSRTTPYPGNVKIYLPGTWRIPT